MNRFLQICLILGFVSFAFQVKSTHFSSGYLTYENVGQDNFIVSLTLIRDCNGLLMNPGSFELRVSDLETNTRLLTTQMPIPQPVDITPTCTWENNRCQNSSSSFPYGYEKYVFTKLVVLNTNACDISFSVSKCCRNTTITTGMASGSMYFEAKLNRCLAPDNSSTVPTTNPRNIFCIGHDVTLSFNVSDKNNEKYPEKTYTYEFAYPRGSGGYDLSFSRQYDYNKPIFFWGFPNQNLPKPRGFHLDLKSGIVSFRPMKVEQTIIAVRVNEFLNEQKIGEITIEKHIIILSCPNQNTPVINSTLNNNTLNICLGDTVDINFSTFSNGQNDTIKLKLIKNFSGGKFTKDNNQFQSADFRWVPTKYTLYQPYQFLVEATINHCPLVSQKYYPVSINVFPKIDSFKITDTVLCGESEVFVKTYPPSLHECLWTVLNPDTTIIEGNPISFELDKNTNIYPFTLNINNQVNSPNCSVFNSSDTFYYKGFQYLDIPDEIPYCKGDSAFVKLSYKEPIRQFKYKWGTLNFDTNSTFKSNKQGYLKIQVLDTIKNCYFNLSTQLQKINVTARAGDDIIACTSNKKVLLVGHNSYYDSIFWSGKNVFKLSKDYYFETENCFNGEVNFAYYHVKKAHCTDYDSLKITVFDGSKPDMKDTIAMCNSEDTIQLSAIPSNGLWSGQFVKNNKFVNKYKISQNYAVFYETGIDDCYRMDYQIIEIWPLQDIILKSSKFDYCEGDKILISAKNLQTTFKWVLDENSNGHFKYSPFIVENEYIPGSKALKNNQIIIHAKTTDSICPGVTKTMLLDYDEKPTANFISTQSTGLNPIIVGFTDKSTSNDGQIKYYDWDFGNGLRSTEKNPYVKYNQIGIFDVTLIVTTDRSCVDTIIKEKYVDVQPSGTKDLEKSGLTIYPNPFTSKILIKSEKPIQTIRL